MQTTPKLNQRKNKQPKNTFCFLRLTGVERVMKRTKQKDNREKKE